MDQTEKGQWGVVNAEVGARVSGRIKVRLQTPVEMIPREDIQRSQV